MTQPEKQNSHQKRTKDLSKFFLYKQKLSSLSRKVLFYAIAIYEKYLSALKNHSEVLTQAVKANQLVIACLWMAWKFLVGKGTTLKVILTALDMKIDRTTVVQAEAHILSLIDYELPSDYTYAALIRAVKGEERTHKKQTSQKVTCQCLRFLQTALVHSKDFSLCSELGPHIWALFSRKQCLDQRIRAACFALKKTTENKDLDQKKQVSMIPI